ncbi:DUF3267 domain-containing protein [Paenisporosarcina indica]|uniref:DUF3267 domain-containing protein n=1 Tax=Paenisporosarcina indica TaxID=650093 RepID=UPI00094FA416|nr:DUF3267 domain-containing protein [Paenisporosarcina indica]
MNDLQTPTKIIELDLQQVGKTSLIWTIGFSVLLLLLNSLVHQDFSFDLSWIGLLLFIAGYIVLIVLHEAAHLIGFVTFARVPWSSLEYGFNLKLGIAYATTSEAVQNKAMRKVLILPFWVTGVLPAVIAIAINSPLLALLGAWLIAGAAGDFAMIKELRKVNDSAWIKDDPELPKLYIFEQ